MLKARTGSKEADTLKAVVNFLESQDIFYERVNPVSLVGHRNGFRVRRLRESQKGSPDIRIYPGEGRVMFVETKSGTGKLSVFQSRWKARAEEAGIPYHVVREISDLLGILG
ncbi:MAG TPA: VRR-NUC domain-containing protein [Candidatus Brocadiales bacterium]|nr:VRR-NUC domain-containing protein [Candidatus Brocadiales bacterium]